MISILFIAPGRIMKLQIPCLDMVGKTKLFFFETEEMW